MGTARAEAGTAAPSGPRSGSALMSQSPSPGPPGTALAATAGRPKDPFVGERVGNCWIVAKLGEGGFGSVYRAIDESEDRPVAVKLVKPERAAHEEAVKKFLRGAIAAAQVEHPNVVAIHRIGRDERFRLHYIVMDHLRGKTLQSILDKRGPLPFKEVIPWLLQAAEGLHAAHEKGVIHRDVKPDNLMLGNDGKLRVTDLGLARTVNKEMKTTRVMGTPHFMAPEQFEGKGMDRRTDVYGFGISLYYLLCHQFPYEGKTSMQIVFAMLTNPPKPLHQQMPGLPEDLWDIVNRMIARTQAERPATMLEVRDLLVAFLAKHAG